jgi:hypothetical protein
MQQAFRDYFRCPAEFTDFRPLDVPSGSARFFRFGPDTICYGRICSGRNGGNATGHLDDALASVRVQENTCYLPFDPDELIENLRCERYPGAPRLNGQKSLVNSVVRRLYYAARPLLLVPMRKHLQRAALRGWDQIPFPHWPVDHTVERIFERMMLLALRAHTMDRMPFIWFWPDGRSACAILTHDVETAAGRDFCSSLMDLDDSFGIKSSFQFVPEGRYTISVECLNDILERGFEVNVHDLNHDGNLFRDREEFLRRVGRINAYGKKFGAAGYRSGALYRNPNWFDTLEFSYEMSVPNVGHLEPQRGGCCTTKPYFIGKILEIPVTTAQDYTLFHILQSYSTDLWKKQIRMIREQNGLLSFIVHPDYVVGKQAREVYAALLGHLAQLRREADLWIALPREVNDWWRMRSRMELVNEDGKWRVEGQGKERARVAYATVAQDKVSYILDKPS